MFKVGDRVKMLRDYSRFKKGEISKIGIYWYSGKLYIESSENYREGIYINEGDIGLMFELIPKFKPKTEIEYLDAFQQNFKDGV